jgi:ribosomal-protein-alanine N-acetyltransferase
MTVSNIDTERLVIIPMSYSLMCSVLENKYEALTELGIRRHTDWPRQDTLDILNFLKDSLDCDNEVSGFDIWMIVKKEDMTIIGDAGFKGLPDEDGNIDIGFGLVDDEQRKGYGYEAANALINLAFSQDGVRRIKADCLINNYGSKRVLEKCKMREVSRDNESIYWELDNERKQ